jgi:DNA-binding NarL/FixJ family response regulator
MTQTTLETSETRQDALRVLIVDDHDLFRTGLRNLLEEQGIQIVGEAAAGAEAIRSVRELAPDVVVMDLNMPGMTAWRRRARSRASRRSPVSSC